MTANPDWKPVVIIGAPRSGTNMLRDLLTKPAGIGTWPCDEINPIWRYLNSQNPTDELPPSLATARVKKYIRRAFAKQATQQNLKLVVEKTCANSLRVAFVDEILSDAKYIFIHRNAIDCVTSASKRWHSTFDLNYSLRKARYLPIADMPYYAAAVIKNRLHRASSVEGRLAVWGPISKQMLTLPQDTPTQIVSAHQWKACVETSLRDFEAISKKRIHVIRYEDFVTDPADSLGKVFEFLGIEVENDKISQMVKVVSKGSINKGHGSVESEQLAAINQIIAPTMAKLDRL